MFLFEIVKNENEPTSPKEKQRIKKKIPVALKKKEKTALKKEENFV